MMPLRPLLFLILVLAGTSAAHAGSVLRIACEGNDSGAQVFVNGAFKGDCPVDVQVAEGEVQLRVVKELDGGREQVFEQRFRIGDGVAKKVEVVLSAPQLNAAAQQRENERLQLARQAKEKADADAASARTARLDASLAAFRAQGADIGNGVAARECEQCPAMVLMQVPGAAPIGFGKYEVTRAQFAAFVAESQYRPAASCWVWVGGWLTKLHEMWQPDAKANWANPGFQQGDDHPVVCVSWEDAVAYTRWLSQKTGKRYRLPSQAEWRDAAMMSRVQLALPWTAESLARACGFGNVYEAAGESGLSHGLGEAYPCNDGFVQTAPVGKFPANAFGIHDLWGNVEEFTIEKERSGDMMFVNVRGGAWASGRGNVLSATIYIGQSKTKTGIRVVRVLD
jgi:formylglycine-generating enzyme required for sulfatase activity